MEIWDIAKECSVHANFKDRDAPLPDYHGNHAIECMYVCMYVFIYLLLLTLLQMSSIFPLFAHIYPAPAPAPSPYHTVVSVHGLCLHVLWPLYLLSSSPSLPPPL